METIDDINSISIEEVDMREEVKEHSQGESESLSKGRETSKEAQKSREKLVRPDTAEAKVYKLKSKFINENVYITLSYIVLEDGTKKPIEIFINSKDLSKLPEYSVLTRLISAIFRQFDDPTFILEELKSIYDPNGGYFYKGKYIYSFYNEIATIIEKFFVDIGFIKGKDEGLENWIQNAKNLNPDKKIEVNNFKICPMCNHKSLQFDGGCFQCINPECGYSKCA